MSLCCKLICINLIALLDSFREASVVLCYIPSDATNAHLVYLFGQKSLAEIKIENLIYN